MWLIFNLDSEINYHMRIHLIAIGGSAMHNMALALHEKGFIVTGSDMLSLNPAKVD